MANITTTTAAVFIPELWANEVKVAREAKIKLTSNVKKYNHVGEYGDIIHIPDVSNLVANDMVENGEVTPQAITEGETTITIDKWKEASFRTTKLAKVQSKYDLRSEYTSKMGYALSKQVEVDLFTLFTATFQGYDADGTAEAEAGGSITPAGILKAIQYLDEAEVPEENRYLFAPPSARNALLQLAQLVSSDYIGNSYPTKTKRLTNIFGLDVYITNLCPTRLIGSTTYKNCIVMHKEALIYTPQIMPRVESEYSVKEKSTLVSSDTAYAVTRFRTDHGVRLRLNSAT